MKGISFNPEMLTAIQEGRKTQTRRVIKQLEEPDKWLLIVKQADDDGRWWFSTEPQESYPYDNDTIVVKPRYKVGETVYIKEAWATMAFLDAYLAGDFEQKSPIWYKDTPPDEPTNCGGDRGKWRSPLSMPAWAARYFIKITGVQIEKLQDISWVDCLKEGVIEEKNDTFYPPGIKVGYSIPQGAFLHLWDSINPKYPWASDPWVIKYNFEKEGEWK